MGWIPGDAFTAEFVTSGSTGAPVNADSLPTGTMAHNGVDDGAVTVTISNIDTGRYLASATIPGTYAGGDSITVLINATISTIPLKQILYTAPLDRPNLVWAAVANTFATSGTIGYQFRRIYAALHGGFTATYPSGTVVDATFLDTDGATTLATSVVTLDGNGRPISRTVT